ncbi:cupin domain-containing protein [Pseudomonas sp. MAP12]|uniref:Cupin domain-containing protein n=1 Tax=Geopseudomonas aromaticivorans TaxID=2849492 RepID=A0ABS6MT91_9GAMM|nr:cupin domain-containing protein [Pseudomonas aromaticivorans]MBV2131614.1 cupin domain-containing protein [Pseudomonas aromaticivorans]
MNIVNSVAVAVTLAAGLVAAPLVRAESPTMSPGFISAVASELKWADAPTIGPGAQIAVIEGDLKQAVPITFRLKLPPGFKIGVHTHPGFERVTVMSGAFYFATGDKFDSAKAKAYMPGDVVMIPSGMPMYAETRQEGAILQVHGTGPWGTHYLDPKDDPRKK